MSATALPWILGAATSRPGRDAEPAPHDGTVTRGDDTELVEQLYQRMEARLTNVVYRWLWNREDVRDVLQDAFVRLWQMRERVDWDRAEPLVYRIALNLASKKRRSRRIWKWVALDHTVEPAGTMVGDGGDGGDREREAFVKQAIDGLPERHRRVLMLSIHSELSYDQIAEVLGISAGTVASRRNSAVAKLRAALARQDR